MNSSLVGIVRGQEDAMEQINAYYYKCHLIVWIDKFECWCIYNEDGDKVREPYWGTTYEARAAIDSGEAL